MLGRGGRGLEFEDVGNEATSHAVSMYSRTSRSEQTAQTDRAWSGLCDPLFKLWDPSRLLERMKVLYEATFGIKNTFCMHSCLNTMHRERGVRVTCPPTNFGTPCCVKG